MNKLYLSLGCVMLAALLIIPLCARPAKTALPAAAKVSVAVTTKSPEQSVSVKRSDGIVEISLREYLVGVTAAEMDINYGEQALCAQMIAAHTLLLWRKAENAKNGYDITDSSQTDQKYLDQKQRAEKFGDSAQTNEGKLDAVFNKSGGYIITYKDKPILAVYHAVSGGKTESANVVWGGDYPYLQPVESVSDLICPQYASTVTYTADEFCSMAKSLGIAPDRSKKPTEWIGELQCSKSGTVQRLVICGKGFSGQRIRSAFGLRSANFELVASGERLVFSVRGYGHGVGMSQYGAGEMAAGGSSFEQILKWYYTGVSIEKC